MGISLSPVGPPSHHGEDADEHENRNDRSPNVSGVQVALLLAGLVCVVRNDGDPDDEWKDGPLPTEQLDAWLFVHARDAAQ